VRVLPRPTLRVRGPCLKDTHGRRLPYALLRCSTPILCPGDATEGHKASDRGYANFRELRECEVRRIPLPRTRVDKGRAPKNVVWGSLLAHVRVQVPSDDSSEGKGIRCQEVGVRGAHTNPTSGFSLSGAERRTSQVHAHVRCISILRDCVKVTGLNTTVTPQVEDALFSVCVT
jgi:hypothetical protein